MARTALLLAAAVVLVAALALVLVPFDTHLPTQGRDGTRLELTVGLRCRAPILHGLILGSSADEGVPEPCRDPARPRLAGGTVLAVTGTGLLAAGIRVQPRRR